MNLISLPIFKDSNLSQVLIKPSATQLNKLCNLLMSLKNFNKKPTKAMFLQINLNSDKIKKILI